MNGSAWNRFEVQVGGSIREQYFNRSGGGDDGSYKHKGYDGGTRFRLHANYHVNDDLTLLSYFEYGVDTMHVAGWEDHYVKGSKTTNRRQVYFGFDSSRYGRLTLGKQNSVYYDTVGVQTDVWDYDMLAQASSVGVSGDYDGSYRARKSAKYIYDLGRTKLYFGWLIPDDDYHLGNGLNYRRKSGGSVGVSYDFTPTLQLNAAYSNVSSEVNNYSGDQKSYRQELTGAALTWQPGQWYLSAGGGYYRNFVPSGIDTMNDFFTGDAYGVEYVAKYTVPVNDLFVKTVSPYVAGDRLKMLNGPEYQSNHQAIGVATKFDYGFRFDLEHTFANTSDNEADATLARVRYDF
ncbi:porin [Modicisalibacter tunisiensis]|uniref:porin n=1 Tax=Modicisalibacter tunisiensis TaxID=390637 RepID=UPI001CCA9285|nr:hypothetical protein [Modicisalibacter tunisiensis]MBZ9538681.1 porin [Modicisalibacter tunisiensis]